jgi:tetratricopeptide (TPR) repeat protein
VNSLIIGLLGALLAMHVAAAASNVPSRATGLAVNIPDPNDPVEREFQQLLDEDDTAQAEVDEWLRDGRGGADQTSPLNQATLKLRIEQRFEPVRKAYDTFLSRHPNHARARLAYGSFLGDLGKEPEALAQYEKARDLEPRNPAAWNNIANYYGHHGPATNAFAGYAKAIELNPREPVYYQNLATTLYLFRPDAMSYFKLSEPQVLDKVMGLYRQALALAPTNFLLASDLAQTYYGLKPPKTGDEKADRQAAEKRTDEALAAWQTAFTLARDDVERQGVLIHLARLRLEAGRLAEAQKNLDAVTNTLYRAACEHLVKKLAEAKAKAPATNAPPRGATAP